VPSFVALLTQALTTAGLSQREFARRVGLSSGAINKTVKGLHVPDWRRGPQWAKALGLRGEQAREFILALAIANAPAPVQRLVAEQQRQLRSR
jgi:transcriptional regulator with XRE-family HTH domain